MNLKTASIVLAVLAMSALLLSCADVSSTGPTPPEFFAQYRFLHAAGDLDAVNISVDGVSTGSVSFKGTIPHEQFNAGSRTVVAGDVTQPIGMSTDERGTVVLLPDVGSGHTLLKLIERRIFDGDATDGAFYRIVHAADAPDINITITDAEGTEVEVSSGFAPPTNNYIDADPEETGRQGFVAGEFTVSIASADDGTELIGTTVTLSNRRFTQVLVGSATDGTLELVDLND